MPDSNPSPEKRKPKILSVENGVALVTEYCCICDQRKLIRKPLDDVGFNSDTCDSCKNYVLLEFWEPESSTD